eukprot:g5031.t1
MRRSKERDEDRWIPYATAREICEAIQTKRISSRRVLEAFLRRNRAVGRKINGVVVFDVERARRTADEYDRILYEEDRLVGPLHGLPITVKENNDVEGLVTTSGYDAYRGRKAKESEVMIRKIQDAGAIIWGKTNLPVGAMDLQSYNPIYGSTSNPWDLKRTPGGSSGGGAAVVAAGISPVELGGDVGGSIRTPAAFCGIFGHKPTFNLIPKRGPHSTKRPKEISVRGVLARNALDLKLALECVASEDLSTVGWGWRLNFRGDLSRFSSLSKFRVAVWKDDRMCRVDDDIREGADRLVAKLREAGAVVDCDARPDFDLRTNIRCYQHLVAANAVMSAPDDALVDVSNVTLKEYRLAQETQVEIRESWERFFKRFDILICPSHATPAFPKDESRNKQGRTLRLRVDDRVVTMPYWKPLFWAVLTNVGLLPSTTFPCGLGRRSRLPVGLNAVGSEWSDLVTL